MSACESDVSGFPGILFAELDALLTVLDLFGSPQNRSGYDEPAPPNAPFKLPKLPSVTCCAKSTLQIAKSRQRNQPAPPEPISSINLQAAHAHRSMWHIRRPWSLSHPNVLASYEGLGAGRGSDGLVLNPVLRARGFAIHSHWSLLRPDPHDAVVQIDGRLRSCQGFGGIPSRQLRGHRT